VGIPDIQGSQDTVDSPVLLDIVDFLVLPVTVDSQDHLGIQVIPEVGFLDTPGVG